MVTLNNCGLRDENVSQFLKTMIEDPEDQHHSLAYIDFTSNFLTDNGKLKKINIFSVFDYFAELLESYNLLEYIGLGNNNLSNLGKLSNFLSKVGKKEVNEEYFETYQERIKTREKIIEKNKKLRTLKKTEVFVPIIDPLTTKDGVHYVYFNKNLKFVNLMENKFTTEVVEILKAGNMKAIDLNFSIERNKINIENIEKLRALIGHRIFM